MTKMHSGSSLDLPGSALGDHCKRCSNEKILLTKVVMYASLMEIFPPPMVCPHGVIPGEEWVLGSTGYFLVYYSIEYTHMTKDYVF